VSPKQKVLFVLAGCLILVLVVGAGAIAASKTVRLVVNGREVTADSPPFLYQNRVFVPLRAAADALGVKIGWEAKNQTVFINNQQSGSAGNEGEGPTAEKGALYLQGMEKNFITATDLKNLLDDDHDNDLADFRLGHNEGDNKYNDPLVLDVRTQKEYDTGHIPGAIWLAPAAEMGKKENIVALRQALKAYTAKGGHNEVVVYCATSHEAGLVCGVLGTYGINAKNLRYGYTIAWEGSKSADTPVRAPREDKDGATVPYSSG
jgi:rhodanese-related sulfurtransferase